MKLASSTGIKTERMEGDVSIKAGIDEKNLPFVFRIVSKSMYSDSIGSIVREITSNALDAHRAAKIDKPIIVEIKYNLDLECYQLHIRDSGTGISPDKIINVYIFYFSSDKRDSDDLIGAYGLGSKSPLSYQDYFYITTVYNGKKYDYMLHQGEELPELDSFNGYETIEDLVTEYIYPNSYYDLSVEEREAAVQSGDIVPEVIDKVVKIKYPIGLDTDEPNGTTITIDIKDGDLYKFQDAFKEQLPYFDNVYVKGIPYENEYTIYEGDTFKYSTNIPDTDMHIVIDTVKYPINFKKLDVPSSSIPVGLKFKIGELEITPERENVKYTEEGIEIIKNKIDLCIKELKKIYKRQNPPIDDIREYLYKRTERPHVKFGDKHKLFIPKETGVTKSILYKDLEDIYIPSKPFDLIYEVRAEVGYGRLFTRKSHSLPSMDDLISRKYQLLEGKTQAGEVKAAYIHDLYPGAVYIVNRTRLDYHSYCSLLGLVSYDPKTGKKIKTATGKAVKIYKLIKYIKEYIGEIKLLSDIEVTTGYAIEYARKKKESSIAYQRRINREIVYRSIYGSRREIKIELLEKADLVIYKVSNNKNDDTLYNIHRFLKVRPSLERLINKNRIRFINIAKTNLRYIKDLDNTVPYNKVHKLKILRRFFRDCYYSIKINKLIQKYDIDLERYSKYYYLLQRKLRNFRDKYYNGSVLIDNTGLINKMFKINKLRNYHLERAINELESVLNRMAILNYVQNNIPDYFVIPLLKNLKIKKLNKQYYSTKKKKQWNK